MYSEYKAYLNMFLVNEDGEKQPTTVDAPASAEKKDNAEQKEAPPVNKPNLDSIEKKPEAKDTDMKFSVDLATEFSNTINEFTTVCAKIVEKRIIDKDLSDKFYDLYAKIKNLADAASKTE